MTAMQTVQDFIDATAFEGFALATVSPLVDPHAARGILDLRFNEVKVQLEGIEIGGAAAREALIRNLRPLLFGAAWKILDLIVEYALNQAHARPSYWRIDEKRARTRTGVVAPVPFDHDIWARLTALYAGTVEPRHCLIHRRFVFTPAGDMEQLADKAGNPIPNPNLTAIEQDAFCRVAQRVAAILQTPRFMPRDRLDIVASLDLLTAHHGHGPLGGGATARSPELVKVDAEHGLSGWTVDVAGAKAAAQKTFPGRPYFDVEINFPRTGFPPLVGRLEEAPENSAVPIDPSNLPAWIQP